MHSTENEGEEWKPVLGFEELYEISSGGRVWAKPRISEFVQGGNTVRRPLPGRLRTPAEKVGYKYVNLYVEGKIYPRQVHRLIAEAFIPNPDGLPFVLHWDDNRTNNSIENLRWGTASDNANDMIRNGIHPVAHKTHCKRGHEFTEENTRATEGRRSCKTCETVRYEKGLPEGDPRHGTYTGYSNWRCRCEVCKEAGRILWQETKRKEEV